MKMPPVVGYGYFLESPIFLLSMEISSTADSQGRLLAFHKSGAPNVRFGEYLFGRPKITVNHLRSSEPGEQSAPSATQQRLSCACRLAAFSNLNFRLLVISYIFYCFIIILSISSFSH